MSSDSLKGYLALNVSETYYHLCNEESLYCKCPHTLAVNLYTSFSDMWPTAGKGGWAADKFVSSLLGRMIFMELFQLVDYH